MQIGGVNEIQQAFLSGRCDAFTTDSSQLAGFRYAQGDKAQELTILPEPIGTGPSGSMVRKGDDKWYDIVRWVHYAQVSAENLGITQANVDSFATSTNPDVKRLLGQDGDLGKALGLDNRWAYNADQAGRQLRRHVGPLHHPHRPATRPERAVDQGRPAVRPPVPVATRRCTWPT